MKIMIGNMFESRAKTLVNTVNCVGVMGKGVAKTFKERYPDMFRDYKQRCNAGLVRPGKPYLFEDLLGTSILNFPTKDHWRSSSRLSYVEQGLDWFRANWERYDLESVAFPPLGCGNGGLDWLDVGPLMVEKLGDLPIEVEVYAPFGTPSEQLDMEFLFKLVGARQEVAGTVQGGYSKKWELVLQAIKKVNQDRYATRTGRTVYQKICYALSRSGVDMGFTFVKGDYGPYSAEASDALKAMANRNLVIERTLGNMVAIDASDSYDFDASLYSNRELSALSRVEDLFCRVRDTSQAERVSTLMFAYDSLLRERVRDECSVTEGDLIEYVMDWKPRWNTEEIVNSLKRDLASLDVLGWVAVPQLSIDVV